MIKLVTIDAYTKRNFHHCPVSLDFIKIQNNTDEKIRLIDRIFREIQIYSLLPHAIGLVASVKLPTGRCFSRKYLDLDDTLRNRHLVKNDVLKTVYLAYLSHLMSGFSDNIFFLPEPHRTYDYLLDSMRYRLCGGARGGGKSEVMRQRLIINLM